MTTNSRTVPVRARLLAALGAASIALIAAAPADAAYRSYEPGEGGDAPIERTTTAEQPTSTGAGCSVTLSTGQSIVYPDGYSFSVTNKATGKKHTYTCKNGAWVETVEARYASTIDHYDAEYAYAQP